MIQTHSVGTRIGAGLVAGMLAGMAMGLVAMLRATAAGLGFWLPMKLIAALFWNVEALIGAAGVVFVGMLIHLAMAGGLGALFGLVFGNRLSVATALLAGLGFGIGVWVVNTWLILPWANPVMLERQMVAPMWWLGYHLIFGAMLFLAPLLVGVFGRRDEPVRVRSAV